MKHRVERFTRFDDAECDLRELAHHRADDELGGVAVSGKPLAKTASPLCAIERPHGGHIERAAQEGVPDLR